MWIGLYVCMHTYAYIHVCRYRMFTYIYMFIVQNEVLNFFFLSSQFLYQIKKLIHNCGRKIMVLPPKTFTS